MSRNEKEWNARFLTYMQMIIKHPNYEGLKIEKKADGSYNWLATKKSSIGQARIQWCHEKARELGYPIMPGVYAKVMRDIHPTKWKVCQTCGKSMSIYYHYPNAIFLKSLNAEFHSEFTDCDHISDIWDNLINRGISHSRLAKFLIKKGGVTLNPEQATKDEIITALEDACRNKGKKMLGPGVMSNFPDRFDGFHSYNRCCRAEQDKGRSKENLKSYTKDRRAYEYWSDGNIHAANQFMGSKFFEGISADHIGPISLGFIHDPRYLQPMTSSNNSSKRDRLLLEDINLIIERESQTGVYPMSWYSKEIWEYIKKNYSSNIDSIATLYRDALKQNMANFMYVLWFILDNCSENGEHILTESFLSSKFDYFKYSYKFNENGEIVETQERHITDRTQHEIDRYIRIAIDSVYDYNDKDNRNTENDLTSSEQKNLSSICQSIKSGIETTTAKTLIKSLIKTIETRLISGL